MNDIVSEQELGKAVFFFDRAASKFARAKADVKFLEHKRKTIRATMYAEGAGTNTDRVNYAERSKEYRECLDQYRTAVFKQEFLATKMKGAELKIDVWRSQNSSKNKGHF
jgi:hypothetical protein